MAELKIQWWPLDRVIPYDNNPRLRSDRQIEDLAKSILEFGWKSAILVDGEGVIIAGHGRRLAALALRDGGHLTRLHPEGLVPVIVDTELPPEKVRAYRIADNKIAEGSDWDQDLLKLELSQLLEELPESMDLTGFSMEDIGKLLGFDGFDDGEQPPGEFKRADPSDPTQHRCPKCGYEWNGKQA